MSLFAETIPIRSECCPVFTATRLHTISCMTQTLHNGCRHRIIKWSQRPQRLVQPRVHYKNILKTKAACYEQKKNKWCDNMLWRIMAPQLMRQAKQWHAGKWRRQVQCHFISHLRQALKRKYEPYATSLHFQPATTWISAAMRRHRRITRTAQVRKSWFSFYKLV